MSEKSKIVCPNCGASSWITATIGIVCQKCGYVVEVELFKDEN